MTIGEALEHARRQAGLTVTEVSQRTRIRETIIAGIEADDYSACGGDFYARGHIRAIARVAGIDSEPLIEEYDAARRPPPDETDEFPAPPASGRRGRRGRGGGAAYRGGLAQGGGPGFSDGAGVSDSAVRSRGSGRGGWLGRGGRDRWEDDQRAGNNGLDEADEPERWPGLGWLGRGYRTDQDDWDGQSHHARPDQDYEPEPEPRADWNEPDLGDTQRWDQPVRGPAGESAPGNRTDWSEPDSGDSDRWDDIEGLEHDEPYEAAEPGPGGRADWSQPEPRDPDRWDEELPGQADEAPLEAGSRAAWREPDPVDPDRWDAQLADDGPGQAEPPPAAASRAAWSDPDPIDPDHWDEQLAGDGPGQAAPPPEPGPRAGWRLPDSGGWDEGPGRGGPGRADGPVRRSGLLSWLGLGDRDGGRPRRGQMVTTWAVLAAVIGFAIYSFVFAAGHRASATGPHRSHTLQAAARHHDRDKKPSPSASPSPATTPAVVLRPASATAFGIGGTGRSDNPGQAGLAIDHSLATAWHSDWYASAHFGNLYSGTGLLVDMGHPVTITAARVRLGPARGTGLALRVGNSPTLAGLHTAATASNAGGVVNLNPSSPVRGRYVLIWLTSLPRDPAGTYEASIFNVVLTGQP